MSDPRIRVVGQPRPEPDFEALARAIIELARLLAEDDEASTDPEPSEGGES
jgi:hypothetical protein